MLNISAQGPIPSQLFRAEQVRELDRILIEDRGIPGITLMRRAASACCDVLLDKWPAPARVRVYCGSGNNAADGFIVAGMLSEQSIPVDVVVIGDVEKLGTDGKTAYAYCVQSGAALLSADDELDTPSVIVDALLGTGVTGAPRPAYRQAIEQINGHDVPVLAVDVPSGLDVDTGAVVDIAVRATVTVTFIGMKRGCFTAQGVDYVGHIVFNDLGAEADVSPPGPAVQLLDMQMSLAKLPKRLNNSHKRRFGHVLVVGGDLGMGGAPLMSALAAMRVGAGLVSLATRPEHASMLMAQRPELMIRGVKNRDELEPLLAQASVVVLGPGIGQGSWGEALFKQVVASDLPLVIDADGLNFLAQNFFAENLVKRDNWVLTPHPGEATRLLNDDQVQRNRFDAVEKLHDQYGGVAVLKGAGTLIASGQGEVSLCPFGNPGMASAGMGDVLAGVIGGLCGQMSDMAAAAQLGVVLHSAAGDLCAERYGQRGLMATDLIPVVRELMNDC